MAILTNRGRIYPPVTFEHAQTYGIEDIEWERIVDRLGRNPNDLECAIFSMLWSESYCNKSSASLLDLLPREHKHVVHFPGLRLGLVALNSGDYIVVRVVANNAQGYIDPKFGVETAMEMALSELSTVGAMPLAVLNLLRFGPHDQIANQRLFQGAVDGISEFGNRIGVPVVGGELYFHRRYNFGTIINSCALGIIQGKPRLSGDTPPFGSAVVYVGARTGKDGLASETEQTATERLFAGKKRDNRTMKTGDPLLSIRLLSACSEAIQEGVLRDVISAGVGGLGTACFDLSSRISNPVRLDIDRVPLRSEGLTPKEILLSETSERLLCVATRGEHRRLIDIFHKWDIDSNVVGQVVDDDGVQFFWNHYQAADIPFLFAKGGSIQKHYEVVKFPPMLRRGEGPNEADIARRRKRNVDDGWAVVRESTEKKGEYAEVIDRSKNLEDTWLDLLANPNLCSRRPIYRLFDQGAGTNAVIRAGGDAAVIRLKPWHGAPSGVEEGNGHPSSESGEGEVKSDAADHENGNGNGNSGAKVQRGLAVTVDSNSLYVSMEPYLGTVQTIAEGMRNLSAVGAEPVGLAYCMNFGDPSRYVEVCELAEAIRGLGDASKIWDIPIVSEFVNLFNGSEGNPILPTPTIMLVGAMEDVSQARGIAFRDRNDVILLLGTTKNEIGCSEYGHYSHKQVNRLVPDIDFEFEKKICQFIRLLLKERLLKSAHDISGGGLAIAFAECALGGDRPIGAKLVLEDTLGPKDFRDDALMFSESSGRFLVSISPDKEALVRKLCEENQIPITATGRVGGKELRLEGAVECEIPLATAYRIWSNRLALLLGHAHGKL